MPYVIRPKLHKALVGAVASAVFLASIALPAAAEAACPTAPTSKAFQRFGDNADYSLVSNGHFESGTAGWLLSGGSIAAENESYKVRSSTDGKSLKIKANKGVAVSPAFCVGLEHPTFRFFAKRSNGTLGVLNVKLRWTGADGESMELQVGAPQGNPYTGDPYKSWQPTPAMVLGSALPLPENGGTLSVRLVFDPEDVGGDWLIDDVYIDPYRR